MYWSFELECHAPVNCIQAPEDDKAQLSVILKISALFKMATNAAEDYYIDSS